MISKAQCLSPTRFIGVGVGPGDPSLMTIGALKVCLEVRYVFAPTTNLGEPGRAETVLRAHAPQVEVVRILFDMARGESGIALRRHSAQDAAQQILSRLNEGESAAFITLGDPNVYSTFNLIQEALHRVNPTIAISSIPGVMAFQQVVSASSIKLLDEEESLILMTGLEIDETLLEVLQISKNAVVIYKGGRQLRAIKAACQESGRLEDAIIGINIGTKEGSLFALSECDDAPYLSTIVIPAQRAH